MYYYLHHQTPSYTNLHCTMNFFISRFLCFHRFFLWIQKFFSFALFLHILSYFLWDVCLVKFRWTEWNSDGQHRTLSFRCNLVHRLYLVHLNEWTVNESTDNNMLLLSQNVFKKNLKNSFKKFFDKHITHLWQKWLIFTKIKQKKK